MIFAMHRSAAAAVVLWAMVSAAQQPRFRGGVELVTVDLRVVGADGQPVVDLTPDDIVLKVDGKERPIKSLGLLRVGVTAVSGSGKASEPAARVTPIAAPQTGRTLILVFDHENIRPNNEHMAVVGAIRALDGLAPVDRVALVTLPQGRIEVDLTTEHDRVRRALPSVVGRKADLPMGLSNPGGCPLLAVLDLLRGMQRVAGPKTFVFISEGFACPQQVRGLLDNPRDVEDLASLAASTRAQFYVVQPDNSMMIDASRKLPSGLPEAEVARRNTATNMLEDIASVTGGDLFRLSGTADAVFERVLRETSAYYELGFEPFEAERDGKDHSITVKVKRSKVSVRARSSFSVAK
jgi:VWFA-related protein